MEIYESIEEFPSQIKTAVTIGTFDGVHRGHHKIIERLTQISKKEEIHSLLLTFNPHPRHVLYPETPSLKLINTIDERIEQLRHTDLNHLVIHKFTQEFSRTKSVNFIRDILVNSLNMKYMVIGHDHHFGRNREGTFQHLEELSVLYGFKIERIQAQIIESTTVSSTKIRRCIVEGNIFKANKYLDSNFSISGTVIHGNKKGVKIGFPTANIQLNNKWKILPKDGVYAVKVFVNNSMFYGMLNIGVRPSINDSSHVIEVHIFNFTLDIYNQEIKIEFIERIRDEKKFDSLDLLSSQLKIDAIKCKTIFNLLR